MNNGHSTKTFVFAHNLMLNYARQLIASEEMEISANLVITNLLDMCDELRNEVFDENV